MVGPSLSWFVTLVGLHRNLLSLLSLPGRILWSDSSRVSRAVRPVGLWFLAGRQHQYTNKSILKQQHYPGFIDCPPGRCPLIALVMSRSKSQKIPKYYTEGLSLFFYLLILILQFLNFILVLLSPSQRLRPALGRAMLSRGWDLYISLTALSPLLILDP